MSFRCGSRQICHLFSNKKIFKICRFTNKARLRKSPVWGVTENITATNDKIIQNRLCMFRFYLVGIYVCGTRLWLSMCFFNEKMKHTSVCCFSPSALMYWHIQIAVTFFFLFLVIYSPDNEAWENGSIGSGVCGNKTRTVCTAIGA